MSVKLTQYTKFSGCGAKLGPALLDRALCGLSQPENPRVLAGFTRCEDAGLYDLGDGKLLASTVDFFPPIVDDPFMFGRIAAANALSDIYAMSGEPITALAMVCFPVDDLDVSVLRSIMEGGLSALVEAGCALVGGHSIDDKELKIGYAISGLCTKGKQWYNGPIEGDCALILTKPIGTGIINMAMREGMAASESITASQESMQRLNKNAAKILAQFPVSACTDVTGFGLAGHCAEMVMDSTCGMEIDFADIPLLPLAYSYAESGLSPGGYVRNIEGRGDRVANLADIPDPEKRIFFDPQTSGGLLAALPRALAAQALARLRDTGIGAAVIGYTNDKAGTITLGGF